MPPEKLNADQVNELINKGVEDFYQILELPQDGPVLIITDAETNTVGCLTRRLFATRLRNRIKPFTCGMRREPSPQMIGFRASDEDLTIKSQTREALRILTEHNPTNVPLTVIHIGKQWEGEEYILDAILQHSEEIGDPIRVFSIEDLDLQKVREVSQYITSFTTDSPFSLMI